MTPFYAFAWFVTRMIWAVLFNVTYEGTENIPKTGGALVVCNHRFLKDPLLLAHGFSRRQLHFMAKAEWFQNKPLGMLIGWLGAFPVNRGEGDLSSLDHAAKLVRDGKLVAIFPEGTRNRSGGPMRPKSGTAFIARQTGADIIPCALIFGEKRGFREKITVRIGKVIPYQELGFAEEERTSLRRASKLIMGRINDLLGWEVDKV